MQAKTIALSKSESLVRSFLFLAAFIIPLALSGPQLIVGTIVNGLLIFSSQRLTNKNLFFICALPSLGAISHGVLFGSLTFYLVLFFPLIWAGNFAFVTLFSRLKKSSNFFTALLSGAILKTSFLYLFAFAYFRFAFVPKIFLSSMGLFQFVTAVLGGTLAYILFKLTKIHE